MKLKKVIVINVLVIITIILGIFVCYRTLFYYTEPTTICNIRNGVNSEFDVYLASKEEMADQLIPFVQEKIQKFNEGIPAKKIRSPREAIKITKQFANKVYDGCSKEEQPFIVYYNKLDKMWIVNSNSMKLVKNYVHGGDMCVVIDAETGKVIYSDHTS